MADLANMTRREIVTHTLRTFQAQYGAVAALPNNNVNISAITIGGIASEIIQNAIRSIDERLMPDTAIGENLDRIGAPNSIFRRDAKAASGAVKVSGPDGTTITGTINRCDGLTYEVLGPAVPPSNECETVLVCDLDVCPSEGLDTCATGDATIVDGCAWVWVQAVTSGFAGNYPAGADLEEISDGVTVVVGPGGITGGCDIECDDDFRRRVILSDPRRPTANSPCDIRDRVATAPGVTRVWIQECCGTLVLCFAMDACYEDSQPQADDAVAVAAFLDDPCLAPLANVKIKPICAQNLAVELTCTGGTQCDPVALAAGLRSWLIATANLGETILRDDLAQIIRALCPGFRFTLADGDFVAKGNGVFTTATVTLV